MAKKAIVLRGPPAIGKTSIKNCLLNKLAVGDEVFLNLDSGHAFQIPDREHHEVLILELAYGECDVSQLRQGTPLGLTRDPKKWAEPLRSQDREIYCFLLYAEWTKAVERVRNKWKHDVAAQSQWTEEQYVEQQKPYHDFYTTEECNAFSVNASLCELLLDFDKSPEELADYVLEQCGMTEEIAKTKGNESRIEPSGAAPAVADQPRN